MVYLFDTYVLIFLRKHIELCSFLKYIVQYPAAPTSISEKDDGTLVAYCVCWIVAALKCKYWQLRIWNMPTYYFQPCLLNKCLHFSTCCQKKSHRDKEKKECLFKEWDASPCNINSKAYEICNSILVNSRILNYAPNLRH